MIVYPNYNKSIVNVANSIRKYFNLNLYTNSLEIIDKYLETNPKNVVVILYDGLGTSILNKHLSSDDFLIKNRICDISSTFPSTTTASTNSMRTGMYPALHGWLGWDMYYKNEDVTLSMFNNEDSETGLIYPKNLSEKYFKVNTITSEINLLKDSYSEELFPFLANNYKDIDDMFKRIKNSLSKKDKNYIYAYCDEPDHTLHECGVNSSNVRDLVRMFNDKTEEFCKSISDTLVIVLSDHGHINCDTLVLEDYSDLYEIINGVYLESRAMGFRVDKVNYEKFSKLFNKYFGEYFILKTKEDILKEDIFGPFDKNKYYLDIIPDFLAIATKDKRLKFKHDDDVVLSTHSGITEEEMNISLIVIDKNIKNKMEEELR